MVVVVLVEIQDLMECLGQKELVDHVDPLDPAVIMVLVALVVNLVYQDHLEKWDQKDFEDLLVHPVELEI